MSDISQIAQEMLHRSAAERNRTDDLSRARDHTDKIVKAIGDVKLDMPEGFKLDWGITINGLKEILVGLDLTIDQVKKLTDSLPSIVDKIDQGANSDRKELSALVAAVKSIKAPTIVIPEPLSEVKVTGQDKVVNLLTKIANKPDFEKTELQSPIFPQSITVDNLREITDKLSELVDKEAYTEDKCTGFSWDTDSNGELSTFTEMYSNGNVVSTGWNLGRVRITDDRSD